jgi:endo-1,4-beta-xylanase
MSINTLSIIFVSIFLTVNAANLKSLTSKIYVGAGIEQWTLSESSYKTILTEEFNSLTPGNEMKWQSVEGTKGQLKYTDADKLVELGQQNHMKIRGHTLIWHSQIPDWLNSLSKTELESTMKKHITDEVTHYKGKIYAWDVVNEAFNEDGTFRDSIWHKNFGSDYIAEALKLAHAADPNAKLYINDYNVEGKNSKSDGLYKLVKELKSKDVPIHGVGLQAHFILGQVPHDLQQNMERFTALGLDVAITELDIRIQLPSNAEKLAQQAKDYASVFKACLSVPKCVGVTIWGFTDKHSWIPSVFQGYGDALPWDANYKPKPAVAAIEEALKGK